MLGMPGAFARWWVNSIQVVCEKAIREEKPDIIFATMSPFDSAIAADALSRRHSIPWVADLRDPWALDEMRIYSSRIHRRLEEKRMYSALSGASAIIMNTPEATEVLLKRFPNLEKKIISTITNGYDEDDFLHDPPFRNDGKFRIVHSGYLHTDLGMDLRRRQGLRRLLGGSIHGVDILTRSHVFLLKAIEGWIAEAPSVKGEIELVFVGATTKGDELIARNGKMQEIVRFTGFLPHADNLTMVRTADLLFLPMHNLPPGRRATIVPGKTYEYMAAGKPILAAVPDGDARDFLEKAGTAYLCGPGDIDAMQEILKRAYRVYQEGKLEKTPNREFISQFERRLLTQKLAGVFNRVLGK